MFIGSGEQLDVSSHMKPSTKIPGRKKPTDWCSIMVDDDNDVYRVTLMKGVASSSKNKSGIKCSVDLVSRKENEDKKKLKRVQQQIIDLLDISISLDVLELGYIGQAVI